MLRIMTPDKLVLMEGDGGKLRISILKSVVYTPIKPEGFAGVGMLDVVTLFIHDIALTPPGFIADILKHLLGSQVDDNQGYCPLIRAVHRGGHA